MLLSRKCQAKKVASQCPCNSVTYVSRELGRVTNSSSGFGVVHCFVAGATGFGCSLALAFRPCKTRASEECVTLTLLPVLSRPNVGRCFIELTYSTRETFVWPCNTELTFYLHSRGQRSFPFQKFPILCFSISHHITSRFMLLVPSRLCKRRSLVSAH